MLNFSIWTGDKALVHLFTLKIPHSLKSWTTKGTTCISTNSQCFADHKKRSFHGWKWNSGKKNLYLVRSFFHALCLSDTAWMEFTESHSLKIQRLGTAKQLHGLHSALTTLHSFMGKPTARAPINSTVPSPILEKNNNLRRTGKTYQLQESEV